MFERIKTYADFAKELGGMILCNSMYGRELELINGNLNAAEEICEWYIIENPSFAINHMEELIYYDNELDLNILAVQHHGTGRSAVPAPNVF